jgi:hypothetical protein
MCTNFWLVSPKGGGRSDDHLGVDGGILLKQILKSAQERCDCINLVGELRRERQ